MNKLKCLSNLLKSKSAINFHLLLNSAKEKENDMEKDFEKLFPIKKINEKFEKNPHNQPSVIGPKRL